MAAGFVDPPLSAAILSDQLDTRRERLRTMPPIIERVNFRDKRYRPVVRPPAWRVAAWWPS